MVKTVKQIDRAPALPRSILKDKEDSYNILLFYVIDMDYC